MRKILAFIIAATFSFTIILPAYAQEPDPDIDNHLENVHETRIKEVSVTDEAGQLHYIMYNYDT